MGVHDWGKPSRHPDRSVAALTFSLFRDLERALNADEQDGERRQRIDGALQRLRVRDHIIHDQIELRRQCRERCQHRRADTFAHLCGRTDPTFGHGHQPTVSEGSARQHLEERVDAEQEKRLVQRIL
jgi:hypothetical protein